MTRDSKVVVVTECAFCHGVTDLDCRYCDGAGRIYEHIPLPRFLRSLNRLAAEMSAAAGRAAVAAPETPPEGPTVTDCPDCGHARRRKPTGEAYCRRCLGKAAQSARFAKKARDVVPPVTEAAVTITAPPVASDGLGVPVEAVRDRKLRLLMLEAIDGPRLRKDGAAGVVMMHGKAAVKVMSSISPYDELLGRLRRAPDGVWRWEPCADGQIAGAA